jgi:FlgD Ig-like domain
MSDDAMNGLSASAAQGTTFLYGPQKFDVGATCNEAGWTKVDLTAQLGSFFHVDDYAGMNAANFAPLAGAHSLWVGSRVDASGPLCAYLALPGYGNAWNQAFCTKNCIAVSGDGMLDVAFLARFDSEPSYDYSSLEYTTDCSGVTGWTLIDGGKTVWTGKIPATNWILGAAYGGSYAVGTNPVKVRLHFQSDGAWSDEDALWNTNGGAHFDNLQLEGGAVEDFEGEAVGATSSNDWQNCTPPGYGIYLALFPGINQVQEDPCARDLSCLWASINGSPYNYACGGFPAQTAVPYGNADGQYLNNEIWSPDIALTGAGSVVNYQFTVYRDELLDNLIFYVWHVRTKYGAGTCPSNWTDRNFVYYGGQKDWLVNLQPMGDLIDLAGGTAIQVGVGVVDMCGAWCGLYGSGACHGHAPLVDQVEVYRVNSAGPQWSIRDIDQFQDNFATDGTLTGTVRADMANDVAPGANTGSIIPGDSAVVKVADPTSGLGLDAGNGHAAVYCYVAVWPLGQAGKSGNALTQNSTRWPVVGSINAGGVSWTCVEMDSSIVNGVAQPDFYCVDLNDNLFTPGDTVCFFYAAKNAANVSTYAYGSALTAQTLDVNAAAAAPSEFTCLPAGGWARGGDILYADGMDGRGAQPFFDTAFQSLGLQDKVDRYDVRGPSSGVSNRLAGRVKNTQVQLLDCYRKIIWDCGDLDVGLGDGSGTPEKTNDYQVIDDFLSNLQNPGGVYLSGDDTGQVLAGYGGTSAVTFRTTYLTYNLTSGNYKQSSGNISTTGVPRNGGCYTDSFIIFGGCPLINDFDEFEPTGSATIEVGYGTPATTNGAVIAQQTVNGNAVTVGAVLSGFSFIYIRDNDTDGVSDRAKFLHDTIIWLGDAANQPTGAGPALANNLSQNYPNPFNPQTTIAFSVKDRTRVSLKVYNVAGQLVRTLADESFGAGAHTKVWDGRNDAGQPVSSGVYFYKLVSNNFTQTKKMVLLK